MDLLEDETSRLRSVANDDGERWSFTVTETLTGASVATASLDGPVGSDLVLHLPSKDLHYGSYAFDQAGGAPSASLRLANETIAYLAYAASSGNPPDPGDRFTEDVVSDAFESGPCFGACGKGCTYCEPAAATLQTCAMECSTSAVCQSHDACLAKNGSSAASQLLCAQQCAQTYGASACLAGLNGFGDHLCVTNGSDWACQGPAAQPYYPAGVSTTAECGSTTSGTGTGASACPLHPGYGLASACDICSDGYSLPVCLAPSFDGQKMPQNGICDPAHAGTTVANASKKACQTTRSWPFPTRGSMGSPVGAIPPNSSVVTDNPDDELVLWAIDPGIEPQGTVDVSITYTEVDSEIFWGPVVDCGDCCDPDADGLSPDNLPVCGGGF